MEELPLNIYPATTLKDIYIQKGKEYKNAISHLPKEIFEGLIDKILAGVGYRECAEWLQAKHSLEIPYSEIQNYVELYVTKETRDQISLCSEFVKEVKVDEVAFFNDLIKFQYERIKSAYKKADTGDKQRFNFDSAIDLFYKMLAKSVELKQSLGLLPKTAEKKEVKTASLDIRARLDGKSLGVDQKGIANVLRLAEKIKKQAS